MSRSPAFAEERGLHFQPVGRRLRDNARRDRRWRRDLRDWLAGPGLL